jgi:hypothetical protein
VARSAREIVCASDGVAELVRTEEPGCCPFQASLNDGSPAYVESTKLVNAAGTSNVRYRVRFKSPETGRTLTIKLTAAADPSGVERVRLYGAYLRPGPP